MELPHDWRLLKVSQDLSRFNKDYVKSKQVKTCWIYYLVDFNTNVYICSLTPTKELWAMFAEVEFENDEAQEKDDGEFELELMRGEDVDYYDSNIVSNSNILASKYMEIPKKEENESSSDYNFRVADESREVLASNPQYF
jgi:hypothetical protein